MKVKFFKESWALWFVRALCIAGIAMLAYLVNVKFKGSGEGAVCELGEGLSCETVNVSAYSEVLGVPVAFLGIGYFAFVLAFSFAKTSALFWQATFFATLFALVPSLYLTGVEIFIIDSICVFCEASKVLMFLILGVSYYQLLGLQKTPQPGSVFIVLSLAGLAALQTWYLQSRSLNQRNLVPLAQCLDEKGVVMYGSYTCAACKRQKETFGSSFSYIKEIECNPNGKNAQVELCFEKKITGTPTWIREAGGVEVGRLVGYQSPESLAKLAGCEDTLAPN